MAEHIDKEIEAIKVILSALEALSTEARSSVLDYVLKRLGVTLAGSGHVGPTFQPPAGTEIRTPGTGTGGYGGTPMHIAALKDNKKPRSANEMAALVAYYLLDLAPTAERKKTINTKDIETYFKIAEFPLPEQVRVTLPNAKAAGYFDAAGDGEYRLNAVGHNLVVHSMPRGSSVGGPARKKRSKKSRSTTNKR